jgi:putative restriction endonuclease
MSVGMAWEVFGDRNGDPNFRRFVQRLTGYRGRFGADTERIEDQQLSCLVLRDAVFLAAKDWLPWTEREDWSDNIVSMKGYDLVIGPGQVLAELLLAAGKTAPADLVGEFEPSPEDARAMREQLRAVREGQGAFRVRLLEAYGGRCAVTGEHALPVLDAAHILPYRGPRSNHIQNGLVLRADLHRLYDEGYVTVTPDLRFEVSPRLRDQFENGRTYYAMAGANVAVPRTAALQPNRRALELHASEVFH